MPFLALLDESCRKYGHRHIVLTDDAMACGDCDTHQTTLPRSLMKAYLAAMLAYMRDPQFAGVPTLFTGADCVLASDPVAMANDEFDLVITTDDRFTDCRMNCGAIYTAFPERLAPVWAEALERCSDDWGDDQVSIYATLVASDLRIQELPCDPYNLAPENPGEDCSRGVVLHFRGPRKAWMLDYCHHQLGIGPGSQMLTAPSVSEEAMLEQSLATLKLGLPEVRVTAAHDQHVVLVGGGPSLASCLPEIRLRAAHGQKIFALNGAAKYLAEHGIEADFGVILDPRAENVKFITHVGEWLIASQCHADVVEAASRQKMSIWHYASEMLVPKLPEGVPAVRGSHTVGLCAMCLVYMMGYRKLHLYGYDSSNAENDAHAYAQAETEPESRYLQVWCGGRQFTCGPAMYAQARDFPGWANLLAEQGAIITVHGDGLLPTVARHMNSRTPYVEEAA